MIPHWLYLEAVVISMVSVQVAVMNKWVRDIPAANKRLGSILLAMTTKMLMLMKTHSTLGRAKTKKLVMSC
jgi:hypothetical protein